MLLFYITCPNNSEAESLVKTLLEEQLIACANILPGMKSFYVWEDEVQHSEEVILLLKAPKRNQAIIESRVSELHSYDCPCILSFEPNSVNPPFLDWLRQSTKD